ncbi:hypothetical protein DFH28DRAFT_1082162 [Melampsora americana]|nr:hypothetical protein DFH28DRAFT_1082162 [Melampsora americana]
MSNQRRSPHHFTSTGCVKHSASQQGVPMRLAGVRHPRTNFRKGRLAVFWRNWAPNFLHSAWGSSLETYLKIAAPESFCLKALHGIMMVVFVVLG